MAIIGEQGIHPGPPCAVNRQLRTGAVKVHPIGQLKQKHCGALTRWCAISPQSSECHIEIERERQRQRQRQRERQRGRETREWFSERGARGTWLVAIKHVQRRCFWILRCRLLSLKLRSPTVLSSLAVSAPSCPFWRLSCASDLVVDFFVPRSGAGKGNPLSRALSLSLCFSSFFCESAFWVL